MGDNVFKENVLRYCEEIIKGSKSQNIILKEEQKECMYILDITSINSAHFRSRAFPLTLVSRIKCNFRIAVIPVWNTFNKIFTQGVESS